MDTSKVSGLISILLTSLMIGNDPVAHKLQDEDEESGGQSKHADLLPQRLHFEIFL